MNRFVIDIFFNGGNEYDLSSPDGKLILWEPRDNGTYFGRVEISNISSQFVGFQLPIQQVQFNIKSTLAQLGIDVEVQHLEIDQGKRRAIVEGLFFHVGKVGQQMLSYIAIGDCVGKLFAPDERRRVRDPFYLDRMFGRADRWGHPLLSLGGLQGSDQLFLEKVDGRCVAFLSLLKGTVHYKPEIFGLLPTLAKGLSHQIPMRHLLALQQVHQYEEARYLEEGELLLVKTLPLHVRTVFARVVKELLPPGYHHTSANVLQPDTKASGDIYEFYGKSEREIADIPLEFFTLEPYREYVFFSDRDQLQISLEKPEQLFKAFQTCPAPKDDPAAIYICKGSQLAHLQSSDWNKTISHLHDFPGFSIASRQAMMVERYIEQQASYPYLAGIEKGVITSQGVLLTRYFPSPLMKRMYLSDFVQRSLKGIYFQYPSKSNGSFFSQEDRAFLHDLMTFGIPVFWVDEASGKILRFVSKEGRESGMFVPLDKVDTYLKATLFGVYGSNLIAYGLEDLLLEIFKGLEELKKEVSHPMLNSKVPIALVTGGGPGVMELGNKVAKQLGILSCANIINFQTKGNSIVNEQRQNPYVEAKMTYRIDRLVERQAEFHLDFPLFTVGGIGTDFEFYLEQVRRKVGSQTLTPIMLLGPESYWTDKITSNFQTNLKKGTIKGSEWISNCYFVVETAEQALSVYRRYFNGELQIGPSGPVYEKGFVTSSNA